ncbi:type IV secretion system protein [Moraxella porci]|uniref:type IV secretion system protein n=1 Tax=Moraxella porci TaxID=1288392 RepID=UPI002449DAA9|nr:type IV secretion system protein [Moraxella porci]MDH2274239.1 type IV secretion system protein [Moraxella porci]
MAEFFKSIFTTIKDESQTIADNLTNVVDLIMPAAQAIFIVYCMFVIWSYWENESSIQGTFIDLMKRIVAWGLVLGLGMNMGTYTSVVMPAINDLGTGLAQAYGGDTADAGSIDGVVQKLFEMTETIWHASSVAAQTGADMASMGEVSDPSVADTESQGVWRMMSDAAGAVGDAVSGLTAGAMEAIFGGMQHKILALFNIAFLWVAGGIFIGVAFAFMLVAQVLLSILAGIGPIFFAFGLFPATRTYFTNWIGSVLNYGFYFLIVIITVQIAVSYIGKQLDTQLENAAATIPNAVGGDMAAAAANITMNFSSQMYVVFMFIIFTVVIIQIPALTSQLFGGLAAGGFSQVARSTMGAAGKVAAAIQSRAAAKPSGGSMTGEAAGKKVK